MITVLVVPYKNFKEKLAINKKYVNKGYIEVTEDAVMIIQDVNEYDGHVVYSA